MAKRLDSTSPPWWTLAQMLVWILQQVEMPPQDAEQFCNDPKIIEEALNALVGALFNVIYGAVKGLPVVAAARVLCGHRYEDLAAFFRPLPSPEPGAMYVLMHELRQFVRQQPDIQFNPTWGRWTWPVCVSATPAAPTPARPSESAVTNKAEPLPNSKIESEESQPPNKPHSVDAPMPVNVGYVDPTIAHALAHATKRARPAYTEDASIIAEIVESLSDLPARSGEAKAPGSDPAARAEESMPGPEPEPEPKPEPEPEPELAKAEHTRWQRDRTIEAMKALLPPYGIRPKGISIAALTSRINRQPEFKENQVSEDTVRLADIEIKAALEK